MVRDNPNVVSHKHSLTTRALRLAVIRIGLVSLAAGAISYYVNSSSIEREVTGQLLLSTEQSLQRESLPFREIKDLQQNFLMEFKETLSRPGMEATLVNDFRQIFYRHEDGSYTQRPQLFEGQPLADGRRFAGMSATYAPDIAPDENTQARFALSYLLSHKYGSSATGRLFNFYGVVPEKGFPIYQEADIAKVFTYSGPDTLELETYEFYARGFGTPANDTLFTRMYWDYSNNAWMTTVATADVADASGKHAILACVDVLLDDLMERIAKPAIQGAYSSLFIADGDGTLIYHPTAMEQVKSTAGEASIRSLKMAKDYPLLDAVAGLTPGQARIVQTEDNIVAMGFIPETPWVLAVHYPRTLMTPAIYDNLVIVVALGLLTLLVEIFILRSILQKQVALPLFRFVQATRLLGVGKTRLCPEHLPIQSEDEIGELARAFAKMAERVQDAQEHLELKVQELTRQTSHLTAIAKERERAETLLLAREQEFRALVENTPDVISRFDLQCRCLYANPAAQKVLGHSLDFLRNKNLHEVFPDSDVARFFQHKLEHLIGTNNASEEEVSISIPVKRRTEIASYQVRLVPERDQHGALVSILSVGRNVSAMHAAEQRLKESHAQLRQLSTHREAMREEERKRIAREIHDELGQQLTALRMGLSLLRLQFGEGQSLLVERIQILMGRIDEIIQVVRNVATALRPSSLDMGLTSALEWLVSEFSNNTGITCRLRAPEARLELDDERATAIFRVIQESLTNVARHAQASRVDIHLECSTEHVLIKVADNGKGFDPGQLPKGTLGMLGMHERGHMLGGTVTIDSTPGQGVCVQVCIPFQIDAETP